MTPLLWAIGLHQVCVLVVPLGWWVPNLTLLGLVAATWARPARWASYAMVAALSVLPWGGSTCVPVMGLYGVIGWAVWLTWEHLELQDRRLQTALVAAAALVLTTGMLMAKGAGSWVLWGWGLVHVLVTVGAWVLWHGVCAPALAER